MQKAIILYFHNNEIVRKEVELKTCRKYYYVGQINFKLRIKDDKEIPYVAYLREINGIYTSIIIDTEFEEVATEAFEREVMNRQPLYKALRELKEAAEGN